MGMRSIYKIYRSVTSYQSQKPSVTGRFESVQKSLFFLFMVLWECVTSVTTVTMKNTIKVEIRREEKCGFVTRMML